MVAYRALTHTQIGKPAASSSAVWVFCVFPKKTRSFGVAVFKAPHKGLDQALRPNSKGRN